MDLSWIAFVDRTHPGMVPQKQVNEDACGAFLPQDTSLGKQRGALLIVADGIGGEAHGEVASALAIETVRAAYYDADARLKNNAALAGAIRAANDAILARAKSDPKLHGMGTTVSAMSITADGRMAVANVGDSRGFILRHGALHQVTVDHTWVAQIVSSGELSLQEALHSQRAHEITRSVGRHEHVEVDCSTHRLYPGDRIVLCTDGLTDMVAEEQIAQLASKAFVSEAAKALIGVANANGGLDNIGIVLAEFKPGVKPIPFWPRVMLAIALIALVGAAGLWAMSQDPDIGAGTMVPELSPSVGVTNALPTASQAPLELGEESTATPTPTERPTETSHITATLAPTATDRPAPTGRPHPTATPAPIVISIVGLDMWGLECSTLVLMRGENEIGRIALANHLDGLVTLPPDKQATWFRFEGQGAECPWSAYSADPADPNYVLIMDGQATLVFRPSQSIKTD